MPAPTHARFVESAAGLRDVTVVLPIFNEERNLGRLLERIGEAMNGESLVYRIVAVNDGSTDGTGALLERYASRLPVHVLSHPRNLGLGMAIRDGLLEAVRLSPPDGLIVTMDADETHTPGLIGRMLEAMNAGYDVAIASRFQPGSRTLGVPFYRRFLSGAASVVFRALFPTPGVRDFTSGYRAYRAPALAQAIETYGDSLFDRDGFECMVDLLLKLRAIGAQFTEVPATLRYDLKEGASKMRVFRTVRRTLTLLARRRLGL